MEKKTPVLGVFFQMDDKQTGMDRHPDRPMMGRQQPYRFHMETVFFSDKIFSPTVERLQNSVLQ